MFENYFISIESFINTLQLFREFQISSLTWLPTKYHNKTNVLLNITNFSICFQPQPSRDFSPTPNHTTKVLKLWLLTFAIKKN